MLIGVLLKLESKLAGLKRATLNMLIFSETFKLFEFRCIILVSRHTSTCTCHPLK